VCSRFSLRTPAPKPEIAKYSVSLPITHDTAVYSTEIISPDLQLGFYQSPRQLSPSYDGFFDDIRNPKRYAE